MTATRIQSQGGALPTGNPPAPRDVCVDEIHGHRVADPYRWLEDADSARTRAWAGAQDAYFAVHRAGWQGRAAWHGLLQAAGRFHRSSAPLLRAGRYFVERRSPQAEQARLHALDADGSDQVVVDPAAELGVRTRLALWRPSWEGERVACQFAADGGDTTALRVYAADGSGPVGEPVTGLKHSPVAWLPGGEAFYYVGPTSTPEPEGAPPAGLRVKLHRVGRPSAEDDEVFGAEVAQPAYFGLTSDPGGIRLVVSVVEGVAGRNDLWLAPEPAAHPDTPRWHRILDGSGTGALASVRLNPDGTARLHTNHAAPRGRILVTRTPLGPGHRLADWEELVAEQPQQVLEDSVLLEGPGLAEPVLLVLHTGQSVGRLTVHRASHGDQIGAVPLPGAGTVSALRADPAGGPCAWFTYTDPGAPPRVYCYDARTGRTTSWDGPGRNRHRDVPMAGPDSGLGPAHVRAGAGETHVSEGAGEKGITCRMVTIRVGDGAQVTLFMLARGGVESGPRPALVTGYGGFGAPMRPAYQPLAHAWAAAGGIHVTVGVRGGGEGGTAWHAAGRGPRGRMRAADDLNDAAAWLVREGWTTPEKLAAFGTSNGGLLVAAALTRQPESYAAAVVRAGLCDMVRYEHFGLGHTWTHEYGSAADPEQLPGLLELSPYHQVRAGVRYPAVLLCGARTDERTGAEHLRKMCAALQHAAAGRPDPAAPVLLRRQLRGGHAAASLSSAHEEETDILTFLAAHTGLAIPEPSPTPSSATAAAPTEPTT
ncbi:prolyl oligopeptidase family serine peptidase [Streptomyces sp. CA-250714]|uniref:prolyl oligopeptidase family serine peptidase n=1 Tax=Streptomyces sp. CA-250714 TaxID=3240060 RepID=UPI003D91D55E